ncbi:MAG: class I SAM-dependent methyltransferase [Nocardioides sp.]
MSEPRDWDLRADELSAEAIGRGDPTAWFDELYAAGSAGEVSMPWDRTLPQVDLREWAEREGVDGAGRRAVVVGCGLGADAEYLASLGFTTTAFDISPTAVEVARGRNPGSSVDYRVADLLALPDEWHHAFDLVVEIFTLQALPDPPREAAADAVTGLVDEGGTLLVVAFRYAGSGNAESGPPFPLGRAFMESLARDGLDAVRLEELAGPRWRATYRR